jgi:hypothetical protein
MASDNKQSPDLDLSAPVNLETLIRLLQATTGVQGEALTKAFADALKLSAPPRFIQIGEYDPKTPWHPIASEAHTLKRECYQNGILLNADQMTNKEIDLLNAIDRSGRYIERLVEVILNDDGAEEKLYIRYRNATEDQRNALRTNIRNFADMMQQIVTAQQEAEAELVSEGKPKQRRRRPYQEAPVSSDIFTP